MRNIFQILLLSAILIGFSYDASAGQSGSTPPECNEAHSLYSVNCDDSAVSPPDESSTNPGQNGQAALHGSPTVLYGLRCDLYVDVPNGPAQESKLIWSGELFPYGTVYIDPRTAQTRDCKAAIPSCVGNLYVKTTTGASGGLFFHIGRILDLSDGMYDLASDITLSDVTSDIHLTYWREKTLIVDCKKL